MQPYGNPDNSSNIEKYGIDEDAKGNPVVLISFKNTDKTYRYTTDDNYAEVLNEMIQLARTGSGLMKFISFNKPKPSVVLEGKE